MKKVIAALAFLVTVGYVQAQTDSTGTNSTGMNSNGINRGTKYEYYPDANVYYNDAAQTYWYHDSTTNQWMNNAQLPSSYSVNDKSKKNSFYYSGENVWQDNANHMKMYTKKSKPKKPSKG